MRVVQSIVSARGRCLAWSWPEPCSPWVLASSPASAADMDCADFSTQASAQSFFLANDTYNDPHNLDSDGDLIACETLPCPCDYTTTPSPSPSPSVTPTATPTVTATPTPTTTATATPTPTPQPKRDWARVVRVVDGDTVKVRLHGVNKQVRMLGLDTPEMPNQCGAERATDMLTTKLPTGTRVLLVSDVTQPNKDRYGRLLRYLEKGSADTSVWQIGKGNAKVFVVGEKFSRFTEYRAAQRSARQHDRGIWGSC